MPALLYLESRCGKIKYTRFSTILEHFPCKFKEFPKKMQQKMKISAIICELNPLHAGHQALFRRAKELSQGLVCILSGNFVQRGEPALLDKWTRTRLALQSGADLVVELPLPWACSGAERFAAGGVALCLGLGGVDYLLFGSEVGALDPLETLAQALLSPKFSQLLRQEDDGQPFAKRREHAVAQLVGKQTASLLSLPNCILAVEYLKALRLQGGELQPVLFSRLGVGHDRDDPCGPIFSASQARHLLTAGCTPTGRLPDITLEAWQKQFALGKAPGALSPLETAILCKLRIMNLEDFASLPDISEGLEHRLFRAAREACSLEEFYALTKTKRYSHARLRRLVLSAFLGIPQQLPQLPPYLRILGMTPTGREILTQASSSLPLVARPGQFRFLEKVCQNLFLLESRADDLYELSLPSPGPCGRDYREKMCKIGFSHT